MKTKTKRGPRRTRNQRVVNKRFVVTDYDGCSYVKAGKHYKVVDVLAGLNKLNLEYGLESYCMPVGKPCQHIGGNSWRYLNG